MAKLPDGVKITWFGHATFVIESPEGNRIMIDPWIRRNPACPDRLKDDPGRVDAILLSHPHFDHGGEGDLGDIARANNCPVICIAETASWLESRGIGMTVGMNKGGSTDVVGCKVHMTHAIHSAGIPTEDGFAYGGEAVGYVLELETGFKIYDSGDTCVFGDMALIGRLLEPDLAILPIGDFYTMGPRSAAEAIRLLGVRTVIPSHWGTFPALVGTPDQLREQAADVEGLEVIEMKPGDTIPRAAQP